MLGVGEDDVHGRHTRATSCSNRTLVAFTGAITSSLPWMSNVGESPAAHG